MADQSPSDGDGGGGAVSGGPSSGVTSGGAATGYMYGNGGPMQANNTNNTYDYSMYNADNYVVPWEEHFLTIMWTYVTPILFGLMFVIGTIGNSLVIYVILAKKQMRTSTNIMLLNLAIADISFLLVCVPSTAYKYASFTWPFGDNVCKLVKFCLYTTTYVTVYTLVAVSVLRYITVVWNMSTAKYRTKKHVIGCVIFVWLFSMAINISTIMVHQVKSFDLFVYCGMAKHTIAPFMYCFFIFAYVLPLLVIIILYLLIMRHLNNNNSANVGASASERNSKVYRVILVVVLVFGLTWLPLHINSILAYYKKLPSGTYYEAFRVLWNCLAYGNSCANPIIYNYASVEFKKSFREIFNCARAERNAALGKHDPVVLRGASKSEMATMITKA